MKKVVKIVLVVILALYAVFTTTVLFMAAKDQIALEAENAELTEKYDELREKYIESSKLRDDDDKDELKELLPYKLFYDSLVQDLRGNDVDAEKLILEATKKYDLDEIEQLSLAKQVEWLITMVDTLSE
jgi:hypothetical protein